MTDDAKFAIRRTLEMAAVFMIGDGVLGVFQPSRHVALWRSDVAVIDGLVRPFANNPRGRRAYGVGQIAAGIGIALLLTAPQSSASTVDASPDRGA